MSNLLAKRMTRREAISTGSAAGIVVGLIVAGGAGYYAGLSSPSNSKVVTQTQTATQIQTQTLTQTQTVTDSPSGLANVQNVARASVPVTIPLQNGYYKGQELFYILTESSDNSLAQSLTSKTSFRVVYAPAIAEVPSSSLADVFVFTNGVQGSGLLGFQPEVYDGVPGDQGYSPARLFNKVTWASSSTPVELKSADDITANQRDGKLTIEQTGIVFNAPMVKWAGGQIPAADSSELTNETGYGKGQILSIDMSARKVVMKAHRCWAQDGSQVYYIVTDASLEGPAGDLGATFAPKTQEILKTPAASDFFVFVNGIKGPGPGGFQSSVGSSKPGDEDYTPFWRINATSWKDESKAVILESLADLSSYSAVLQTEPMMGGLNVNCPFVEVQ
ncbi:MAG: hypothetical protein HYY68_01395 [Thaumarchaeota archaeon]|nr:hypothetical protein [Nitrososphaerota archaeon]